MQCVEEFTVGTIADNYTISEAVRQHGGKRHSEQSGSQRVSLLYDIGVQGHNCVYILHLHMPS